MLEQIGKHGRSALRAAARKAAIRLHLKQTGPEIAQCRAGDLAIAAPEIEVMPAGGGFERAGCELARPPRRTIQSKGLTYGRRNESVLGKHEVARCARGATRQADRGQHDEQRMHCEHKTCHGTVQFHSNSRAIISAGRFIHGTRS